MSNASVTTADATALSWSRASYKAQPGRMIGVVLVLVLRYLFGLFFLGAGINKLRLGWLWSDKLAQVFTERLAEIDPESFAARFLQDFGIPFDMPIAWVVTIVEFAVAAGLFLGLATRVSGALAVWLMVMFAIGGYYDASLIPLWLIGTLFVIFPTGHWLGMDRRLHHDNPQSVWFR